MGVTHLPTESNNEKNGEFLPSETMQSHIDAINQHGVTKASSMEQLGPPDNDDSFELRMRKNSDEIIPKNGDLLVDQKKDPSQKISLNI